MPWIFTRDIATGQVTTWLEPPKPAPSREHQAAIEAAASAKTLEYQANAAERYARAVTLLGACREGALQRAAQGWVTNRGEKDAPRRMKGPFPSDPCWAPRGVYIDPDDPNFAEATAGRFWIRDVLEAERGKNKC